MARDGSIVLPWGDRDRTFRLGLGEWRKVQEACDAGPEEIAARLLPTVRAVDAAVPLAQAAAAGLAGRWRIDDIRAPIYHGLLGGDPELGAVEVARLMAELVDGRPLRENAPVAFAIVMASVQGVPDEPPKDRPAGELTGEPEPPAASPVESSASPTSTAPPPARTSRPAKPTG